MERVQPNRFIDLTGGRKPAPRKGVDRRGFLAAASALAAATAMAPQAFARNFGPDAPPVRYPEPDVVPLDKRFKYKLGNTPIMRLYTGTMWAEGPAWNGVGRYLLWSDIPNNEQLRWLEEDGHVARRFRYPSGNSNGNTFDFQGRQIACEHGTRKVVRYEYNGKTTVLAEKFDGKEFNAPNDAVVHPNDGSIWFTDPGYGSLMEYEGNRLAASANSASPIQKEAVYRIDGQSGAITKVADEPFKPNGLCFSHDYKKLYVADTGVSHYDKAKSVIWVYDIDGAKLTNGKTFVNMEWNGKTGFADGIRCDEDGNIWSSAGWVGDGYDGVHIFAPDGARIGQIKLPEICSNVCFGGSKRNRLFMTGSQSLYAVYVETRGAHIT
ncbi:SMP-30/gluconolactonase/LRE family protein [Reyranella sp. CPCC 100927]|uniref:SMP-30/gluconolactonase/LRE family protein n=1 Tax=Reyranella sp. CPCC 100927 TaxID=2599616 RepID=UPI0011B6C60C|nr:SMP-30/gluconolactonase/LRE family protein [Reyranella sp. CPCC 100927]TWT01984.1 SMP-30/gluconolactonase/LRE family protein [Reyranella sp. CPCC 100927]